LSKLNKEESVTIGLRIGEVLSEANASVSEGITITLSIATFGAVESEISETDFLDICKRSYRSAIESIERQTVAREFEKKEN